MFPRLPEKEAILALLLRAGHGKAARSARYRKLSADQARALVKAADRSLREQREGKEDFVVKLSGTETVTLRTQRIS